MRPSLSSLAQFFQVTTMKNLPLLLVLAAGHGVIAAPALAQTNVNWTGGTGNWTNGAAWFNEALAQTGFMPSADFSEIARIDGGGGVSVTTPLANGTDQGASTNPGEVRLATVSGTGELIIASGGTLRVQDAESTDGGLEVGGGPGAGVLRVLPGGALTADGAMTSAANPANLVQLGAASGAGTASVNVGSAAFGGTTIVHRNAAFQSGSSVSFQPTSVYRPVFSGGLGATLQATGAVGLGGTLQPDFGGVAPVVGSMWNLIEGASAGGSFANIDSSLAGALGPGQAFVVSTASIAGGRQAVKLSVRQLAVLSVNRDTGVASLTNPGATPVSLDGYTIASPLGSLGPSGWNSLQEQGALGGTWRESPATTERVSELKRTSVGMLAPGQSVSLGTLYAPTPTMIGEPTEDLALQFASPDGVFNGLVTYTGTKVNNILLQVDPSSGHARLRNTSSFTVQIDGYTIASAAGSLTPAGWTSLDDQNAAGGDWRESPGSSTRLSELKRSSFTTLAPGASFDLGALFNASLPKDLAFQFLPFGQSQPSTGQVLFTPISSGLPSDFNDDGQVNAADLAIWRGAFGASSAADADNDGDSDGADFLVWQRNLSASALAANTGSLTAAPEPTSLVVAMAALACLFGVSRGQGAGRHCPHAFCASLEVADKESKS